MGLAAAINDVLHAQLNCHVAWLPLSNTFALGDYGVFSNGVFTKLGNVSGFGIGPLPAQDGPAVKLDFVSSSTQVRNLVGQAEVDVIPEGALDAKIKFVFDKAGSFLLRAPAVKVRELEDVDRVMRALREKVDWRRSYKLVAKVWRAENATLLSTIASNTELTIGGSVPALKKFALGDVSADLNVAANRQLGLELMGATGVVGLGLIKQRLFGGIGEEAPARPGPVTESVADPQPPDDV
jgi:hypothetical protein